MPAVALPSEDVHVFRPVRCIDAPVFRQDNAQYATFYAPGYLCVVSLADADRFESFLQSPHKEPSPPARSSDREWSDAGELRRRAEKAVLDAKRLGDALFEPECLTLYLNNECNLGCVYCYAAPTVKPADRLELDAIYAAAEIVARHCRHKGRPLYVVFHGGGEPSLHSERVDQVLHHLRQVSLRNDIDLFRYIATNGVMTEDKVRWLARRFDLVGLSCDGPPDIQNRQRPLWDGSASSNAVERTARILREEGCPIHVRTTLTRSTLQRQAEIAGYICQQFSPTEIHFEPVYVGGRASGADGLGIQHGKAYVDHLVAAREVARQYGIPLITSGSRIGSIHGPHCNVYRSVLNLVPGGVATACFKLTQTAHIAEKDAAVGAWNRQAGRFQLHHSHIQELRRRLSACWTGCEDCFNRYHCVRECPDACLLDGNVQFDGACQSQKVEQPGFRCYVQKRLTWLILQERAEELWASAQQTREKRIEVDIDEHARPIIQGTLVL